ncbi:hypothetical protein BpHYR1_044992 [Brachionus plicatilis]|uniref:Uncharacterized protein n=1 Tax=Brachionus plicatilis TaxID=10195 RepID=A0A3M7RJ38_BRAPC|nr:hypothetical protein BpHYR1_044992 [Brachionus plicatilis]
MLDGQVNKRFKTRWGWKNLQNISTTRILGKNKDVDDQPDADNFLSQIEFTVSYILCVRKCKITSTYAYEEARFGKKRLTNWTRN